MGRLALGPCRFVDGHSCAGEWPKDAAFTITDQRIACASRKGCMHWRWGPGMDQQRAAREKRTVPMPRHENRGPGNCSWCGGAIFKPGGTPRLVNTRRGWHDGRGDEPECLHEFYLHSRRETQFRHVRERDGLTCCDCGQSPERWQRENCETSIGGSGWVDHKDPRIEWVGRYIGVDRVTALELEHEVPLWKVAHLPDEERRPYYGPTNLRLRCPACHRAKTAREAAERAALRKGAA